MQKQELDKLALPALLLFLAILSLFFAAVFWSGPYFQFDDMLYTSSALGALNGTLNFNSFPELLTVFAVLASFRIFGISLLSSSLPALISYIALVELTFLTGKKLGGNLLGLSSAIFALSAPFVLPYTTRVLPDLPAALVFSASLMALIYSERSRRNALFFASGFLLGLTPLFKTTQGLLAIGAFAVGIAVLIVLGREKNAKLGWKVLVPTRKLMMVVAGALMALLIGAVFFWATTGDPLYNIHAFNALLTIANGTSGTSGLSANLNALNIIANPLFYIASYSTWSADFTPWIPSPVGLLPMLALAGTVIAIRKMDKTMIFLSIVLWLSFFYLFFGTQAYTVYTFIRVVLPRYMTLTLLPMSLLGGYSILSLYRMAKKDRDKKRAWLLIMFIMAIALLINFPVYLGSYQFNRFAAQHGTVYSQALESALAYSKTPTVFAIIQSATFRYPYMVMAVDGNRNITIMPAVLGTIRSPALAPQCNGSDKNSFLFVSYDSSYGEEATILSYVRNWSGMCTLNLLASFSQHTGLNGGLAFVNATLYQVK